MAAALPPRLAADVDWVRALSPAAAFSARVCAAHAGTLARAMGYDGPNPFDRDGEAELADAFANGAAKVGGRAGGWTPRAGSTFAAHAALEN